MDHEVYKLRLDIGRCRYLLRNVLDAPAREILEDMIAEAKTRLTLLDDGQPAAPARASQLPGFDQR